MISAQIHGKLQNPEDVLTSSVFDLLSLLPARFLWGLFSPSFPPTFQLSVDASDPLDGVITLWKRMSGKEPDVHVILGERTEMIIEVKYGSGESSVNQLRNYYERLTAENKVLIYLTDDRNAPQEVLSKYNDLPAIVWLSWYELNMRVKEMLNVPGQSHSEHRIISMIHNYLNFKDFIYFSGWHINAAVLVHLYRASYFQSVRCISKRVRIYQ